MSGPSPLCVLAALEGELAPLRSTLEKWGARGIVTGVGPQRAEAAARTHCPGAALVLSTGCCGALLPGRSSGLLAIPDRLLSLEEDGRPAHAPDPDTSRVALARTTARRLGLDCGPPAQTLVTVSAPLRSPHSKRACGEKTGAAFVDMESAAIARIATELGIPYLVIRFVLDTAEESLPEHPGRRRESGSPAAGVLETLGGPAGLVSAARLAVRLRRRSKNLVRLLGALLQEGALRTGQQR